MLPELALRARAAFSLFSCSLREITHENTGDDSRLAKLGDGERLGMINTLGDGERLRMMGDGSLFSFSVESGEDERSDCARRRSLTARHASSLPVNI
jgi:hypothetical protein